MGTEISRAGQALKAPLPNRSDSPTDPEEPGPHLLLRGRVSRSEIQADKLLW